MSRWIVKALRGVIVPRLSASRWHRPGAMSVWVWLGEEPRGLNGPLILVASEWKKEGLRGVAMRDYWLHHDDGDLTQAGSVAGVEKVTDRLWTDEYFAEAIAEGKLYRIGEFPRSPTEPSRPPARSASERAVQAA